MVAIAIAVPVPAVALTVPMPIPTPIARRGTSLERLLLPHRFPETAKHAALLINRNLLGWRLLDLLDLLYLLALLDPPLTPVEPRFAGDTLDPLQLRPLHALDLHRSLLALGPVVRHTLGAFGPMFCALGALFGSTVAFAVAILCHGGGGDHRSRHQDGNQKLTHHSLHHLNPTWWVVGWRLLRNR